jgi:hypothetical protein
MKYLSPNRNTDQKRYDSFIKFFDKIPHLERKIYKYYYVVGLDQREIAKITGLTQGAISYRLSRMNVRFDFLERLDSMCGGSPEKMFKDLSIYCDPFEVELLKALYETTSQSHSAIRLNALFNITGDRMMNQIKVKHKFSMILKRLQGTGYFRVFNYINSSLYMLSDVRLPQYDRTNDG